MMNRKAKNPLGKRIWRDIAAEKGKYLSVFIFITIMVGIISGMLVASNSMMIAYDEGIVKYNLEDGHFVLQEKAEIADLEEAFRNFGEDVVFYPQYFYNFNTTVGENEVSIRVYQNRKEQNMLSVFEGILPQAEDEIAIDRLFAAKNELEIGDSVRLDSRKFEITALVAFPDYSCLYESNSDMMFKATDFSVAVVSDKAFDELPRGQLHYGYAYTYEREDISDQEAYDKSNELMEELYTKGFYLEDFLMRQNNKAITFAREDMGSDSTMVLVLLYLLIVLLGFIFAMLTNSNIEHEAAAIGTLRASGYRRGELIRHYMAAPMLVSVTAAVLGNILGYSFFKDMAAALYYNSYSLTVYDTIWNARVFVLTTVIPMIILFFINFIMLSVKMKLSPLAFLRKELTKRKSKNVCRLPAFKFFTRFRIRVLFQNISSYLTMIIGIILANVLYLFGATMLPVLNHHTERVLENAMADYQYVLKAPAVTEHENAEKYCLRELIAVNAWDSEVSVYGLAENSDYADIRLPEKSDEVIVSEALLKISGWETGDNITLYEEYGDGEYTFRIAGTYDYPAAMSIFMSVDNYNSLFDKEEDYFTGYLSNEKLDDISEDCIYNIVTLDDLSNLSDQLNDSMGAMMPLIKYFSVVIYVLVIYLLAKIVLDKNAGAISLTKILGYNTGEIGRIYIVSTAIAAAVAVAVSIPLAYGAIQILFKVVMVEFGIWAEVYIAPIYFIRMILTCMICYGLITLIQLRKINRIPMEEALKCAE